MVNDKKDFAGVTSRNSQKHKQFIGHEVKMNKMTQADILTVIALFLNFVGICVVAYQTYLNRKSLDLAKTSINEDCKTRQIEMLPRANYIFSVQSNLQMYIGDIEKITDILTIALANHNTQALLEISSKALQSPKGLVHKSAYENGPTWLTQVWLAGAQYYYDFHAPLNGLWDQKETKPFWVLVPDILARGKDNCNRIRTLLTYIKQTVPEAYANAPASLSDSAFLSD